VGQAIKTAPLMFSCDLIDLARLGEKLIRQRRFIEHNIGYRVPSFFANFHNRPIKFRFGE
jgi:hypothetical protein